MSDVRSYRPSLDGLRALAIAVVMLEHGKVRFFEAGGLGVDIFFVLSGYLITGLLAAEHDRIGTIGFKAFYLRRLTRLYPALIALVTVGAVVIAADTSLTLRHFAKPGLIAVTYFTDLMSFGHGHAWAVWGFTWSLSIEEHFYLLWPPLLLLLLRRTSRRSAAAFAGVGAAVGVVLAVVLAVPGHAGPPTFYFQPQAHVGGLLLGCAVALVTRWPDWVRHLAAPAFVLLVAVLLLSPSPLHENYFRLGLPVVWLLTAALLAALEHETAVGRLLGLAPWRLIGVVSYGLYLYHQVVFRLVMDHVHVDRVVQVPVQMAASVLVAVISYRFLEWPVRRWGRRVADRQRRTAAPDTQPAL